MVTEVTGSYIHPQHIRTGNIPETRHFRHEVPAWPAKTAHNVFGTISSAGKQAVRNELGKCNVFEDLGAGLHDLRHSHATILLGKGSTSSRSRGDSDTRPWRSLATSTVTQIEVTMPQSWPRPNRRGRDDRLGPVSMGHGVPQGRPTPRPSSMLRTKATLRGHGTAMVVVQLNRDKQTGHPTQDP